MMLDQIRQPIKHVHGKHLSKADLFTEVAQESIHLQ